MKITKYSNIILNIILFFLFVTSPQDACLAGKEKLFEKLGQPLLKKFSRWYSEEFKRNNSTIPSLNTKHVEDELKWGKGEFRSPTLWVRLLSASTGIILTGGAAWWTTRFGKEQEDRSARMAFLSKTRSFLNRQLKENSELFSQLFADASYKQGKFQSSETSSDKEENIKKYLGFSQKINISLKYYDSLEKLLNASHPSPTSSEALRYINKNQPLISIVRTELEMQKKELKIAKYLNKTLLYIAVDNFDSIEKNINKTINLYSSSNTNVENLNKKNDPLLATFYNLSILAKIKKAHLTLESKEEFINTLDKIIKNDLSLAERADPNNPYIYEHKFFIYLTLKKHGILKSSQAYEKEIEENAIKTYTLAPKNPACLNVMGVYKSLTLNYFSALSYFEKALILLPNYPPLLHNLAMTNLCLGRKNNKPEHFQTALHYAQQAKELSPGYKSLGIYIEALAECGKCIEAYEFLEMFKEICIDSISCQRGEKFKAYENITKEKCKSFSETNVT